MPPIPSPVRPATLLEVPRLSRHLTCDLLLASETFQVTGSFKIRAAFHVAATVSNPTLLTASSGNFGQSLAHAGRLLGKKVVVVMPESSARVKVEAVRAEGGQVDLIDVRQTSRKARVEQLARQYPEAYLASAYDDPLVIEGNASLGRELAGLDKTVDMILAPLGGGGLTAGLLTGLRAAHSSLPVHAVEPALANDAARSLREGSLVSLQSEPPTLADGVRTLSLGRHNWEILRRQLGGVFEVSEKAIRQAVQLLFHQANLKAEPTGALGLAALLEHPDAFRGRRVCVVVSGGNVDADVYARLLTEVPEDIPS